MTKNHKDLIVWQKSIDLVDSVYDLTLKFPTSEKFGLSSQMQRSAVSIPANIAEGSARNTKNEFIQFLFIARGSLAELETHAIIALRRQYIPQHIFNTLESSMNEIGKMLTALIRSLRN